MGQEASTLQQEDSSETESLETEPGLDMTASVPVSQCSGGAVREEGNLDLQTSKFQQELPSDTERLVTKPDTEASDSTAMLQVSEVMNIEERIRNFNLNSSKLLEELFSEIQNELNESQTQEHEEIINLKRDVSLCLEVDNLGNKKLLVNGKFYYVVTEKHKITCNIEDGAMQFSFQGNNILISAGVSRINCTLQKNQTFSFNDHNTTQFDIVSNDPDTYEFSESKDIEVIKYSGHSVVDSATIDAPLIASKLNLESSNQNVDELATKIDSPSIKETSMTEKKKITCNIEGGDVQLSFFENTIYIFTLRSQIDCMVQNKQLIFSFSGKSATQIDTLSDDLNTYEELSEIIDETINEDSGKSNVACARIDEPVIPSEVKSNSGSESVYDLIAQAARQLQYENLETLMELFMASSSYEEFESSFLKTLRERSKNARNAKKK